VAGGAGSSVVAGVGGGVGVAVDPIVGCMGGAAMVFSVTGLGELSSSSAKSSQVLLRDGGPGRVSISIKFQSSPVAAGFTGALSLARSPRSSHA